MKKTILLVAMLGLAAQFVPEIEAEAANPVRGQSFEKIIHLATPQGDGSGRSYSNAKAMGTDADLLTLAPGMIVENIFVVVDEEVAGVTSLAIGDDDSSTGFLPVAATNTYLATKQVLGYNSTAKGTYLKDASDNAQAKLYAASGKEVKLDATGTLGVTGKVRVHIRGHYGVLP